MICKYIEKLYMKFLKNLNFIIYAKNQKNHFLMLLNVVFDITKKII